MAELADALDLGSSGATRTGSIPASRTNIDIPPRGGFIFDQTTKKHRHTRYFEYY